MMLEVLFAHQQQQQAFLTLVVCGVVLGLMLHGGALLRRFGFLRALWDGLTAVCAGGMIFLVALRFQSGLRAYAVLGLLLGVILYMAGLSFLVNSAAKLVRKVQKNRRPKAGETPLDDESSVQRQKGEVSVG